MTGQGPLPAERPQLLKQRQCALYLLTATTPNKRRFDRFIKQKPILLRPSERVTVYFTFPVTSKLFQIKLCEVNTLWAARL